MYKILLSRNVRKIFSISYIRLILIDIMETAAIKNYNPLSHGIQFVTNPAGIRTGVLIDLEEKETREIWEDFYDGLVARKRDAEPRESLENVRRLLKQKGRLNE